MPFTSPKRKISDTENKLRVLYCLEQLGMATKEQLWPFVAQLELMEYIPFCMFVDELLSDGAVASGAYAMEGSLFLTGAGRQQLMLFSDKIVHADKERIIREAPAYVRHLNERRQVRAAYELAQDGCFRAVATVCEGDVPTLLLRACSRDEKRIEQFVNGFPAVADQVLVQLYMLPLKQADEPMPSVLTQEEAMAAAAPGKPALCAFGGREHAAVVCLQDRQMQYTLLALLPNAEMAWNWAHSAQLAGCGLAAGLSALLIEGGL
ncbi:MAG: DUF4364 family protein [Clostridia bacterium]|nr:DUF4364 family protein [Clostridia bacterium]